MIKHAYWEYSELKQLHLLRSFFSFQNGGEPLDLERIDKSPIQKVYLLNIMLKQTRMIKFRTDNEYAFITETIFSSIPQAFLQAGIFHENFSKYIGSTQLWVQSIRICVAVYSVSEGSSSFIDYFPSFLFNIEITSSLFYVLRIITNVLFFSSRLMCIVIAFHYYRMAAILILSGHFLIHFFINFCYLLNPESSHWANLFMSFYIVSLRMSTFFEESSLDLIYIFHSLISWLENIFFAYSFRHKANQTTRLLESYLLYFSIFSFLVGLALEAVFVRKFIKMPAEKKYYSNSIINESFQKTKLEFNSVFV